MRYIQCSGSRRARAGAGACTRPELHLQHAHPSCWAHCMPVLMLICPATATALQEPVAFWGGVFAGVLRLSLTDDPLKAWVERTTDAARVRVA